MNANCSIPILAVTIAKGNAVFLTRIFIIRPIFRVLYFKLLNSSPIWI